MFKELGTYGDVYGNTHDPAVDASQMDLDKITKNRVALKALRLAIKVQTRLVFLMLAFHVLLDDGATKVWLDEDATHLQDGTASKYWPHVYALLEVGLLLEWTFDRLKGAGKYFAVLKSLGPPAVARAIWNGRKLSRLSKHPPPVNLPYLPEILRRIADLTRKHGRPLTMFTLDWASYFHQCGPVSEELSSHFCVLLDEDLSGENEGKRPRRVCYRWTSAPMGWAWSPWACLSLGWACLLHTEKGEDDIFEISSDWKSLPSFVPIKGGGFMCLYYDNLLCVGADNAVMDEVKRRLLRNMSPQPAGFNFEIKAGSMKYRYGKSLVASKADVEGAKIDPIEYLGSAMFYRRDASGRVNFCWRQCDKKLQMWKDVKHPSFVRKGCGSGKAATDEELRAQGWWTCREVASIIGKILWRRSISLDPLCRVAPIIAILRRAADSRKIIGWDGRAFELEGPEATLLSSAWGDTLRNPVHSGQRRVIPTRSVYMATDASDNFWGEIFYDEDGTVILENPHEFSTKHAAYHIFLKELLCCSWSIKAMLARDPGSYDIHVCVDNSAAAAALRHMYSSNLLACLELDDLWDDLKKHHCVLHVHSVRSADNSADMSSRNFDFKLMDAKQRAAATPDGRAGPEIARRCWDEMQAQIKGWRLGAHVPDPDLCGLDGIRHGELNEDAVSPEACWVGLDPRDD